jgi:endoglucanase
MKAWLRVCLSLMMLAMVSDISFADQAKAPEGSPVARHGRLKVVGSRIVDASGQGVQLRGMSTMGLQWFGGIVNEAAFRALALDWKADVVRLAMYVGEGGYATNPSVKAKLVEGVDLAIRTGLYVIVDWHVLNPGNPNDPIYAGADAFFKELATKYAAYPNLIYEIANEPNGSLNWKRDILPYAQRLVSEIRALDPDNLIIIGSGRWSQDLDFAADDPVAGANLAYTVHFYAGTHGSILRSKVESALDKGVAVFATEWGTSLASGDGGPFLDQAREWLRFLGERGIGWANWSLCDKAESSAAFKPGTPLTPDRVGPGGIPAWGVDELSESGAFVRSVLRGEEPLGK